MFSCKLEPKTIAIYVCKVKLYSSNNQYICIWIFFNLFLFTGYVTLIKQAVIERGKVECPTYSTATDDIQIMNNHIPLPLTSEFVQFSKRQLIERHRSRFSV